MRPLLIAVLLLPAIASAAPPKLTLPQVIEKAMAGPKARMAEGDRAAASARIDEADAARYPRIKATAFGTASPEINCVDDTCIKTDPQDYAFRFQGVFGGGQIDITQPLFTFGKIDHARKAARAGLAAQTALADEAAGDIAVDAARAYWGAKLAREMGYMLDDGIEQIEKALAKMNGDDTDKPDVSIQARQRVAVLLAEARVQRADARLGEEQALAGLRALVGIPDADIDDSELAASTRTGAEYSRPPCTTRWPTPASRCSDMRSRRNATRCSSAPAWPRLAPSPHDFSSRTAPAASFATKRGDVCSASACPRATSTRSCGVSA